MLEGITVGQVAVFVAIGLAVLVGLALRSRLAARNLSGAQMFPGGIADATLQADVWLTLLIADKVAAGVDSAADPCKERQVTGIEMLDLGLTAEGEWDAGPWTERWMVDRCGTRVAYTIDFTPGDQGRTDFSIRDDIPFTPSDDAAAAG